MHNNNLYIGAMTGTSTDGIDAVITQFNPSTKLLGHYFYPFAKNVQNELIELSEKPTNSIHKLAVMNIRVGKLIAKTILQLLEKHQISPKQIKAIGSHGQTIKHFPNPPHPYSWQIGDPNTIAEITGITTVADFRQRDVVSSGQGAPLAPLFHKHLFQSNDENRVIINIGGISNITYLSSNNDRIIGFDCGPGNILLDAWCKININKPFDENGSWANSGKVNNDLLELCMSDPFFTLPPPKSTGREYFNLQWIQDKLSLLKQNIPSSDVQRTLVELTTINIANAIKQHCPDTSTIIICGGGAENKLLLSSLQSLLKDQSITTSNSFGVNPKHIEAMAFAWFAHNTINKIPSNCPSVTGATKSIVLGGIYL